MHVVITHNRNVLRHPNSQRKQGSQQRGRKHTSFSQMIAVGPWAQETALVRFKPTVKGRSARSTRAITASSSLSDTSATPHFSSQAG